MYYFCCIALEKKLLVDFYNDDLSRAFKENKTTLATTEIFTEWLLNINLQMNFELEDSIYY